MNDKILDITCAKQFELDNPGCIFITCLLCPRRPGAVLFSRVLELRHYPPGSPSNDKFNINVFRYEDIIEYIIAIPKQDYQIALQLADECKLQMKLGDNLIIVPEGFVHTGITDGLIYVLSNKDDHNVYSSGRVTFDSFVEEDRLIELEEIAFYEKYTHYR